MAQHTSHFENMYRGKGILALKSAARLSRRDGILQRKTKMAKQHCRKRNFTKAASSDSDWWPPRYFARAGDINYRSVVSNCPVGEVGNVRRGGKDLRETDLILGGHL